MRCPACGRKFARFASWPLALGRPVVCGDCGTQSRRQGKYLPALIAVAALLAFHQMIGMFAFTFIGTILLLAAIIILAMSVDEATIRLTPLNPAATPPPESGAEPE